MVDLIIAVPVIVAVVSAIKTAGLNTRWAPVLSIVLGLVFFFFWGELGIAENLFTGLLAGLSASGLYSGGKTVLK
jgi:hypothetical protein